MTTIAPVVPSVLLGPPPTRWQKLRTRLGGLFGLIVVLPVSLSAVYYGLIASDVYISESRFVIRSPEKPALTGFAALLQGTSLGRAQDDTYAVLDYMVSRDALIELDQQIGIRRMFEAKEIDRINRFPGLRWSNSLEEFLLYYQDRVAVDYNPVSSVSVLTVRAYTASDSQRINEALLRMSERLVNDLNGRVRKDLVENGQREATEADAKVRTAAAALSEFRGRREVFDPQAQSGLQLQAVGHLQEELLASEAQLAQLRRVAPDNPQISSLRARVEVLKQAIARESARVTKGDASLSGKVTEYEHLLIEKTAADQQLAAALATLESARNETARQHLYLERLVRPGLPDHAMEPRRMRSIATALLLSLLAWGVLSLVVAGIREHHD